MIQKIIQKIKQIITIYQQSVTFKAPEKVAEAVTTAVEVKPTIIVEVPESKPVTATTKTQFKTKAQLTAMTKDKLEAYGRLIGIELDKRKTKAALIEQLLAHQEHTKIE